MYLLARFYYYINRVQVKACLFLFVIEATVFVVCTLLLYIASVRLAVGRHCFPSSACIISDKRTLLLTFLFSPPYKIGKAFA